MDQKYNGPWSRVLYTKVRGNRTSGSRDKMFKAFQNIWAWKPTGHVTNIFISSYLKFTYKNLSKKAKWFLLLALKSDLYVKYVKVNPWALFIHTMMGLM